MQPERLSREGGADGGRMRRGAGGCVSSPRREMTLWARCGAPKRRRHVWLRVCRLGARVRGDSEDNCVERNAIQTIRGRRDGEWQLQSGAETSVVRDVTITRFYTVVRLDSHRVSGATSRLPRRRSVSKRVSDGRRARRGSPASEKPKANAIPTALCLPPKAGRHNRRHEP